MFDVQQTTAGEWAVVTAGARALLVAETDTEQLRRLHAAVRCGFAETLDALVSRGLSTTPSFALLDASAPVVLLAVRGRAEAAVGVPTGRTIDAGGVSSWLETQLADADSVALGRPVTAGLPLVDGVVMADGVVWIASDDRSAVQETIAVPTRRERETGPVDALEPAEWQEATEAAEPGEAPDVPVPAESVTRVPTATLAEGPVGDAGGRTGYDHLFGETLMRSVEEAAMRPEEEADASRIDLPPFITDSFPSGPAGAEGDHDGMTVMSGDLPPRSPRSDAGAPSAPVTPSYSLRLFDGRRETLVRPVVVGRAPSVSAAPRLPSVRPVTLTSAEDDISRSHVAVAVEGDSVVVTDLHSRNGTLIVLPGKSPQKLRSGEPTTVVTGTLIDLGSGVTMTVELDA